jgi:hypothetical protein
LKVEEMVAWLVGQVETSPSSARRYCAAFVAAGVSSVRRLGKQLDRNPSFLIAMGVSRENGDEDEIIGKQLLNVLSHIFSH